MSLGPIRELSAGPKPGGVSTFTKRLREWAKEARKKEREGGRGGDGKDSKIQKGTSDAFTSWALSRHLSGTAYSEKNRTIYEHRSINIERVILRKWKFTLSLHLRTAASSFISMRPLCWCNFFCSVRQRWMQNNGQLSTCSIHDGPDGGEGTVKGTNLASARRSERVHARKLANMLFGKYCVNKKDFLQQVMWCCLYLWCWEGHTKDGSHTLQ